MSGDLGDRLSKIIGVGEKTPVASQSNEVPRQYVSSVNKTVVAVALILALASCAGYYLWTSSNRFALTTTPQGQAYQIDTKTGEAWILTRDRKIPVELNKPNTPNEQSLAVEQSLPADELAKLTGNGQIADEHFEPGRFKGRIYNGSSWIVTKLVLRLTAKEGNGNIRWSRNFSVGTYIPSLTASPFSVSLAGEVGIQDCPWEIVEAFGRSK